MGLTKISSAGVVRTTFSEKELKKKEKLAEKPVKKKAEKPKED